MTYDLERFNTASSERAVDRLPVPPAWTQAGQIERRAAGQHLVDLRNVARRMELQAAHTFARMQGELIEIECEERILVDLKLRIERQARLSQAIAGDNPELQTKYAVLDDTWFSMRKTSMLKGFGRS